VKEIFKEISAPFSVFVSEFSSQRKRTKSCLSSQSYPQFFTTGTYKFLHKFPVLSAIHEGNVPSLAHKSPVLSASLHDGNVSSLA
jgi:hypothetical protein